MSENLKKIKTMPTIFTVFGLRFMFYSDDHEPVHVHIKGGGREAKYMSLIEAVIEENVEVITERWQEFFKQK